MNPYPVQLLDHLHTLLSHWQAQGADVSAFPSDPHALSSGLTLTYELRHAGVTYDVLLSEHRVVRFMQRDEGGAGYTLKTVDVPAGLSLPPSFQAYRAGLLHAA